MSTLNMLPGGALTLYTLGWEGSNDHIFCYAVPQGSYWKEVIQLHCGQYVVAVHFHVHYASPQYHCSITSMCITMQAAVDRQVSGKNSTCLDLCWKGVATDKAQFELQSLFMTQNYRWCNCGVSTCGRTSSLAQQQILQWGNWVPLSFISQ